MVMVNLGVRFLSEVGGVVCLAWWGAQASTSLSARVLLAILTPGILVFVWARFIAPGADSPLPMTTRMVIGTGLLLLSALALAASGHPKLAALFGAVIAVNAALMVAFPDSAPSTP
jgi:hypothetical protein